MYLAKHTIPNKHEKQLEIDMENRLIKTYMTQKQIDIIITLLIDSQKKLIKDACHLPESERKQCLDLAFEHGQLEIELKHPDFGVLKAEGIV